MARKALIEKQKKNPKFSTRAYSRCQRCGRSRAFLGDFSLCRLCFRLFASKGFLPGVKKSSW